MIAMKKAGVMLFLVVAVSIVFFVRVFRSGEISEKPVYATLQAVELEHRNALSSATLFVRKDDLLLAGVPIPSGGRVWIVLNRSRDDGARIFSIPEDGETQVKCSLVEGFPTETNQQVWDVLRTRCTGESR